MISTPDDRDRPFLVVVDDAADMLLIVQRLGRHAGYDAEGCLDAATAWELLSRRRPDLLLLDINLPGENGLSLCRRLRRSAGLADLPIAIFSHWDRPEDMAAGLEAGADFVLSKDLLCRAEAWQARLREILSEARDRTSGSSPNSPVQRPVPQAEGWVRRFNQALQSQCGRRLGPEVLAVLVRKAAAQEECAPAADWLLADGLGLCAELVARSEHPEAATRLVLALAELIRRVLGSDASADLRARLAGALPELEEALGNR